MTPPEGLRLIDADEWARHRFAWAENVRRDTSINVTSRMVAHVLAFDFANHMTMQCDPSQGDIAAVLGVSEDTVKRAIRDLESAAWITKIGGRGRGRKAGYGFLTSAKVIHLKGGKFAPSKGGKDAPLSGSQKGANLHLKGGKFAPAYNKAKPYKNHKAREASPKPSQNPLVIREAEEAVTRWRDGRSDALSDLKPWVRDHIIAAGLLSEDEARIAGLAMGAEKDRT